MAEYIALFCPHCGAHVNEDELDSDHGYIVPIRQTLSGSKYRCGWCKIETTDWNHVLACRAAHQNKPARTTAHARLADMVRLHAETA